MRRDPLAKARHKDDLAVMEAIFWRSVGLGGPVLMLSGFTLYVCVVCEKW